MDKELWRTSRLRALALAVVLVGCGDDGADDAAGSETTADASDGGSSGDGASNEDTGSSGDAGSSGADTSDGADASSGDTGEPAAAPIVLVHGAFMGAWAWDEVTPLLEAAGHSVIVVELPAHGDDATPPADATLDSYRDAVVTALDGLDGPAVVVGHSMGGMVASVAAEARPEAIAKLVYVAAIVPTDGQTLLDVALADPDSILPQHLIQNEDGTSVVDPEFIGEVFCGDCSDEDVQRIVDLTGPEPGAPLATPVSLTEAAFGSVPRAYIRTAQDAAVSPAGQDAILEATPAAEERTLDTAHAPFLSQPEELADLIVELAGG